MKIPTQSKKTILNGKKASTFRMQMIRITSSFSRLSSISKSERSFASMNLINLSLSMNPACLKNSFVNLCIEAISKKGFWFKIKAGPGFNQQAYNKVCRKFKVRHQHRVCFTMTKKLISGKSLQSKT